MSHEATEMRFTVSETMDKVVGGERGRGLVAHFLAYRRATHMGPKITGPGSSDVGALLVRHGRGGSPWITPAHLALA
jgi:hypothetical protein